METALPSRNSLKSSFGHWWSWLGVLAVVLFVGVIRFRLLDMPLERDEGEYAYAGQLILQGIPPYELAYNMKLPGTYYAYAVGMAVFGQTVAGIHLTLLAINSVIVIWVFLLARKLLGDTVGLVSCASYGAMSVSPQVLGLAAHANFFVLVFALPGTLILCRPPGELTKRSLFLSGILYGLAFLMKQQGVFFGFFGLLIIMVHHFRQDQPVKSVIRSFPVWKQLLTKGLIFGSGAVLPVSLIAVYLAVAGVFPRFWYWVFTFAHFYATTVPLAMGEYLLGNHLNNSAGQSVGLWILALAGAALGLAGAKFRKPAVLVIAFWIFSFLATATGFYFRRHYFILVLPAFAILLGLAVVTLQNALRAKLPPIQARLIPLILFAGLLSWNVLSQSDSLFLIPPDENIQAIYGDNPFVEARLASRYIQDHASPHARIAVIGSEPEIYFYTKLHSATGYMYMDGLMAVQPEALDMQHEMRRQIETSRPDYLVYVFFDNSWMVRPDSNMEIIDWAAKYISEFYDRVGLVAPTPNGEIASSWDDVARTNGLPDGHYLAVFKRKPDSNLKP